MRHLILFEHFKIGEIIYCIDDTDSDLIFGEQYMVIEENDVDIPQGRTNKQYKVQGKFKKKNAKYRFPHHELWGIWRFGTKQELDELLKKRREQRFDL